MHPYSPHILLAVCSHRARKSTMTSRGVSSLTDFNTVTVLYASVLLKGENLNKENTYKQQKPVRRVTFGTAILFMQRYHETLYTRIKKMRHT